jgi:hypothetical protein
MAADDLSYTPPASLVLAVLATTGVVAIVGSYSCQASRNGEHTRREQIEHATETALETTRANAERAEAVLACLRTLDMTVNSIGKNNAALGIDDVAWCSAFVERGGRPAP